MKRLAKLAPAVWTLLTAGCVQLDYTAANFEDPVPPEVLGTLHPGSDDLASCLKKLGAPFFVWEYRIDGMALGWVSEDATNWGLYISYSFEDYTSASANFDWDDSDLPGVVLWFGSDLRLEKWRQGRMRDLVSGLKKRPASTEDQDG